MREEAFLVLGSCGKCLCDWCNLDAPRSYQSVRCMGSYCCGNPCIVQVLGFVVPSPSVSTKVHIYLHCSFSILTQCPLEPLPVAVASNALQCDGDPDSAFWQRSTHKHYTNLENNYLLRSLISFHRTKIDVYSTLEGQKKTISVWNPPASLDGHSNMG